jgi:hypothetical protein
MDKAKQIEEYTQDELKDAKINALQAMLNTQKTLFILQSDLGIIETELKRRYAEQAKVENVPPSPAA